MNRRKLHTNQPEVPHISKSSGEKGRYDLRRFGISDNIFFAV